MSTARLLLLADTHLGFDLPAHPRIQRRRRGHDFFANFELALLPALRGEVDLVVHGGDLFYRSKVAPALVEMALAPLLRVADRGVPVYIVPGNHERSRIPLHLWAAHRNIHVFDAPKTLSCSLPAGRIALSGFPYHRDARQEFGSLVNRTRPRDVEAAAHFLCMHQIVEGAKVGVNNYTFRSGADVVQGQDIPGGFTAILSGHIHRAQQLHRDLVGMRLSSPVIYPGSIERTSFAEREEEKGYVILSVDLRDQGRGALSEVSFIGLPARPMVDLVLEPNRRDVKAVLGRLGQRLLSLDPNAVVRVQVRGPHAIWAREILGAPLLRELAPPTMNISLALDRTRFRGHERRRSRGGPSQS